MSCRESKEQEHESPGKRNQNQRIQGMLNRTQQILPPKLRSGCVSYSGAMRMLHADRYQFAYLALFAGRMAEPSKHLKVCLYSFRQVNRILVTAK